MSIFDWADHVRDSTNPKPPFPTAADILAGSQRTWSEAELTHLIDARIATALRAESFEPPEEDS